MLSLTPLIILSHHPSITGPHLLIIGRCLSTIDLIDQQSFIIPYRFHAIVEIRSHIIEAPTAVANHILELTVGVGSLKESGLS